MTLDSISDWPGRQQKGFQHGDLARRLNFKEENNNMTQKKKIWKKHPIILHVIYFKRHFVGYTAQSRTLRKVFVHSVHAVKAEEIRGSSSDPSKQKCGGKDFFFQLSQCFDSQ